MQTTLIGKMDGENIVVLPESEYMVTNGASLVDDIVEVLGRIYKVTARGKLDITQQYCVVAGWHDEPHAITKEDVL